MAVITIGIFTPWARYQPTRVKVHELEVDMPRIAIIVTILVALALIFGLTRGIQVGRGPFS